MHFQPANQGRIFPSNGYLLYFQSPEFFGSCKYAGCKKLFSFSFRSFFSFPLSYIYATLYSLTIPHFLYIFSVSFESYSACNHLFLFCINSYYAEPNPFYGSVVSPCRCSESLLISWSNSSLLECWPPTAEACVRFLARHVSLGCYSRGWR
jgi:hypothetical protein